MKTFLITGATSGIGKQLSFDLAKLNYNLILIGRNKSKLENLKNNILNINSKCNIKYFISDFSNIKSVCQVCNEIKNNYIKIDYIFQNAGSLPSKRKQYTKDNIPYSLCVNFISPYILLNQLLPLIKKSDCKTIIHTTSLSIPNQFDINQIDNINNYSRIKSYAISKLFASLSYFYLANKNNELKIRLFDPKIVYTNAVVNMIPKYLRFLKIIPFLIFKSTYKTSKELLNIINNKTNDNILYYKGKKIIKPKSINYNFEFQEFVINYVKRYYHEN